MTNKELVLKFYDEVFNDWDTSHLGDFVRPDYIQHNPDVEHDVADKMAAGKNSHGIF